MHRRPWCDLNRARAALLLVAGVLGAGSACSEGGDVGDAMPAFIKEADAIITSRIDALKLGSVTHITGSLIIRPSEDLGEIALPQLQRVDGAVSLRDVNTGPAPLRLSLVNLGRVGQNVEVVHSDTPVDLVLPALRTAGGHLVVDHAGKVSLSAPRLTELNGDLRVQAAAVTALTLDNLAHIGGSLRVDQAEAQTDAAPAPAAPAGLLLALPALTAIEGDVRLRASRDVTVTAPLLAAVGGDLDLEDLRVALHLDALGTIGGNLRAERVVLVELGLSRLQKIGGALVASGITLQSGALDLPVLASVGTRLEISEAGGLTELTLPALAHVGGHVRLALNGELARVSIGGALELPSDLEVSGSGKPLTIDLPQVTRLGGSLVFSADGEISVSLPRLQEVVGSVRLLQSALRGFALPALTTVGQHLEIVATAGHVITAIELPALHSLGGNLVMRDTTGLGALSLPLLAGVGGIYGGVPLGSVLVTGNDLLSDLGLPALRSIALDLVVRNNAALDPAAALATTAPMVVGGKRDVCGNRGGLPACP